MHDVLCQVSTPDSPTYVAAVVEYSPVTGSPGDSVADIVSKNVAQYVPLIGRAAEQVGENTCNKIREEMALGNEILLLHIMQLHQHIWYGILWLDFILSLNS